MLNIDPSHSRHLNACEFQFEKTMPKAEDKKHTVILNHVTTSSVYKFEP